LGPITLSMPPIHYRVMATLPDAATADRYLTWLTSGHVAEVCRLGRATARVIRLRGDRLQVVSTYEFASQGDLERYETEHAPRLRAEGVGLFPPESGITFVREYGEVLGRFGQGEG